EGPVTRVDLQAQSLQGVESEEGAVSGSSEHDPRRPPKSLGLEDGLSDRSFDLPPVRQSERADLGRLDADAGRDLLRDPRERGPGVDDEVADFHASHIDRIQDDPGMRDSHGRRSHAVLHRASPYMYITTDKRGPSAGSPRVPETMGRALDEAAKALARAVFGDRPAKRIQEGRPFGPR